MKYQELAGRGLPSNVRALVDNDLAVLSAVGGDVAGAREHLAQAIARDTSCVPARHNLALLDADALVGNGSHRGNGSLPVPSVGGDPPMQDANLSPGASGKVAILSFLFNWPSTGGGIIHTVELASFLRRAGYDARHIFVRYPPWGIGSCQAPLETPCNVLEFDDVSWTVGEIQRRYRQAVEDSDPDWVIITDSWNFKPLLAQAVQGYPYFLRQQALECLCPLNNLRLLVDADGQARQCPLHQLATPAECLACLAQRGGQSGSLHQLERALAGVGTPQYDACLRTALREAQAVLALNPLVAALLEPYCRQVRVATWGMDPARFPWPWPEEPQRLSNKTTLFMGGVIQELIKGFHVLHAACQKLWRNRQDFELVATGEPVGRVNEFTRFVGWLSQEELPRYLRAARHRGDAHDRPGGPGADHRGGHGGRSAGDRQPDRRPALHGAGRRYGPLVRAG